MLLQKEEEEEAADAAHMRSVSRSVVSDSLRSRGLEPARLLCPWDSPGNSSGVGCHALLQGIFPTQELNRGLLHCRQTLYHLSCQGSPSPSGCPYLVSFLSGAVSDVHFNQISPGQADREGRDRSGVQEWSGSTLGPSQHHHCGHRQPGGQVTSPLSLPDLP